MTELTAPSILNSRRKSARCSGRESSRRLGQKILPTFPADPKKGRSAGRDASGKALNVLAQNIPWFLGGSGDLGPF